MADELSVSQLTQYYSQDLQVVGCVQSSYEQIRVKRTRVRQY